jgi:hypothetical protein
VLRRTGRRLTVVVGAALAVAVLTQLVRAVGLGGHVVLAVAAVLLLGGWVLWGARQEGPAS